MNSYNSLGACLRHREGTPSRLGGLSVQGFSVEGFRVRGFSVVRWNLLEPEDSWRFFIIQGNNLLRG